MHTDGISGNFPMLGSWFKAKVVFPVLALTLCSFILQLLLLMDSSYFESVVKVKMEEKSDGRG